MNYVLKNGNLRHEVTPEQKKVLDGMMYHQHCERLGRIQNDADCVRESGEAIKDMCDRADKLGVPFWVQNAALNYAHQNDLRNHYLSDFYENSAYACTVGEAYAYPDADKLADAIFAIIEKFGNDMEIGEPAEFYRSTEYGYTRVAIAHESDDIDLTGQDVEHFTATLYSSFLTKDEKGNYDAGTIEDCCTIRMENGIDTAENREAVNELHRSMQYICEAEQNKAEEIQKKEKTTYERA